MNYEPDKTLERLIQEELHQLPDLKAPPALIQRVNARIHGDEFVYWWRQSWLAWPVAAKFASTALFLALFAFSVSRFAEVNFASYGEQARTSFQSFSVLWDKMVTVMNGLVLLNRVFTEHFLIWALPVLALMAIAAIAAGSGLWRLTLQENHKA